MDVYEWDKAAQDPDKIAEILRTVKPSATVIRHLLGVWDYPRAYTWVNLLDFFQDFEGDAPGELVSAIDVFHYEWRFVNHLPIYVLLVMLQQGCTTTNNHKVLNVVTDSRDPYAICYILAFGYRPNFSLVTIIMRDPRLFKIFMDLSSTLSPPPYMVCLRPIQINQMRSLIRDHILRLPEVLNIAAFVSSCVFWVTSVTLISIGNEFSPRQFINTDGNIRFRRALATSPVSRELKHFGWLAPKLTDDLIPLVWSFLSHYKREHLKTWFMILKGIQPIDTTVDCHPCMLCLY